MENNNRRQANNRDSESKYKQGLNWREENFRNFSKDEDLSNPAYKGQDYSSDTPSSYNYNERYEKDNYRNYPYSMNEGSKYGSSYRQNNENLNYRNDLNNRQTYRGYDRGDSGYGYGDASYSPYYGAGSSYDRTESRRFNSSYPQQDDQTRYSTNRSWLAQERQDYRNDNKNESTWEQVKSFFGKGPKGYKRSDERIREEICEALYHHSAIDASEIDVTVQNGEVVLKGTVDERRMKRLAEDCAEGVSGVNDVRNEIRVQAADQKKSLSADSSMTLDQTDKTKSRSTTSKQIM